MTAHPPASLPEPTEVRGPHTRAARLFIESSLEDGEPSDFIEGMTGVLIRVEAQARADERRAVMEQVRAEVHDYMEAASLVSDSGLTIDRDDFDTILDAALSGPADPTEDGS